MNTKTKKLILLILFVAAVLRLWKLGSIPPHLTPDEAALGYNAYSILKTGRGEYGELLPIIFKSFGDFKPGLYVYLTVPFVWLLGLTEFAVRLPSALTGVAAVWLLFLITKEFINGNSMENARLPNGQGKWKMEILAPTLLAISPWHIHFSRGAWEANVSLTLTLAGIYFFLRALKKQTNLFFSAFFFALTLLTYQGAKLSTAIVVLIPLVFYWRKVVKFDWKVVISSIIVGLVFASPIIFSIIRAQAGRLTVFSVFSYPRPEQYLQDFLDQGGEQVGTLNYYLYHSEALNFTRGILGRWFNHFSGRFLFFEGDWQNPRHSAPNHGVLLLADMFLLVAGFVALARLKDRRFKFFVLSWLILASLPGALSRDQVHAVRSLNMVIPLTLINAIGMSFIFSYVTRLSRLRVASYVIILTFYLLPFTYFLDSYFIHLPKHDSELWSYGNKQIVETVTPIQDNYEEIRVQQSFAQPYIYFLFYQKYDPAKYQKQAQLVESEYKGDVGYVERLDNICFCAIDWQQDKRRYGTLVVADNIRIPDEELQSDSVNLIKEIRYLDGDTAFYVVEVK